MLEHDRQSEINVRENGRRSPEWIIQRPWQNWARNAREVDKINKNHNAENWKDQKHGPYQATGVNPGGREFLFLIRHIRCVIRMDNMLDTTL